MLFLGAQRPAPPIIEHASLTRATEYSAAGTCTAARHLTHCGSHARYISLWGTRITRSEPADVGHGTPEHRCNRELRTAVRGEIVATAEAYVEGVDQPVSFEFRATCCGVAVHPASNPASRPARPREAI